MVGIVIVSHSEKLAQGVVDLTEMMTHGCPLATAGGMEDGGYGTSYGKIMKAIESVYSKEGVVVLFDIGSAAMTTEMVLEDLPYENVQMLGLPDRRGCCCGHRGVGWRTVSCGSGGGGSQHKEYS